MPGLLLAGLFFVAGALLVSRFSLGQTPFRASSLQLLVSVVLIIGSIAAAFFAFPRPQDSADILRSPVSPMTLGIGSFLGGSAFLLTHSLGETHLLWQTTASLEAIILVAIIAVFAWANSGRFWTSVHSWSAAVGGLAVLRLGRLYG